MEEESKAVQELAKTTGQAIKTLEKIGGFFARIMKESIDATCGMMADTLKFKRWQRQLSLIDKVEREIVKRGLTDRIRPVPAKLAIPIFQGASLEEDESLHDIWANLLVTALDPSCENPRSSFIDIIRQLEPIDVRMLNFIYGRYLIKYKQSHTRIENGIEQQIDIVLKNKKHGDVQKYRKLRMERFLTSNPPTKFSIRDSEILATLGIDSNIYWNSIDNLIRQRLISSYIENDEIPMGIKDDVGNDYQIPMSYNYGYKFVCLTALGASFVKACTINDVGML